MNVKLSNSNIHDSVTEPLQGKQIFSFVLLITRLQFVFITLEEFNASDLSEGQTFYK